MRLDSVAAVAPHLVERLDRFSTFTMAHPWLVAARDELMDAIDGAAPGSLVLVLGPTGVGKTKLRMKVENLLVQQMNLVIGRRPRPTSFRRGRSQRNRPVPLARLLQPPARGNERATDRFQNHSRSARRPRARMDDRAAPISAMLLNWLSAIAALPSCLLTKRNTLPGFLPAGGCRISWTSSSPSQIGRKPCTFCSGLMSCWPFVI